MRPAGIGARAAASAVIVLAVACVGLVAFAPTAAAQESGTYVVEQGDQCIEVDAISGDETAEEFYDYRNDTYSSHGTFPYQQDDVSQLIVYEGPQGTSLVMVHDAYHETRADGTNGSSASFTLSGLPSGSDWAIRDDNYGGTDDDYEMSGSSRDVLWRWDRARTDGAAYRLGTGSFAVEVDATFNENRWSDSYHGTIDEWKVVTGTEDGVQRETLDTSQPVTISPGTCGSDDPNAPTAQLDAPDAAAVDETVTLDASGSETGPNDSYQWFVDGEVVEGAAGNTHETSFSEPGTHNVRVEVTDDGGTDSAEATVEVTEGPTAAFESDASGTEAGQDVVFNASDSTGEIASYEWDLGDGSTATGEEVTHAYEQPGTYDVQLTVTDEHGNEDATTRSVEITQPGPTANLEAPESADAGETVTVDASSSQTGSDASYTWYVDREEVPDAEGPTLDVSFSEPGNHHVRVEVTDGGGTDTAEAEIQVDSDIEASATADRTTVDVGEEVTFDGSDSEGSVDEYRWEFGDDTTATGETATHSYDEAGKYLVELVVESPNGYTSRDTVEMTVEDPDRGSGGTSGDANQGGGSGGADGSGDGGTGGDSLIGDGGSSSNVELDNGTAVVTLTDVRAGDPVEVDLSSDGENWAAVSVSSVEIVPGSDAEEMTVRFQPIERSVPGRFTRSNALDPMTNADVESITYDFAVDEAAMTGAGVTEENLTAYRLDDEWTAVETETRDGDDGLVATATVEGDDPVAVGAEGPALYVTGVRSDGPLRGSTLDVVATVRNTGDAAGERTLTLEAGDEVTEVPVSLEAGEEIDVRTNVTVADAEDRQLRAGATRQDVVLVSVENLTVEPTTIGPGESVTVEANVRNVGATAGEVETEFVLANSVAGTERVALEPGESTAVTFQQRIESPGTYDLSVGGDSETVTVEGGGDDDGAIQEATQDGAGFGPLAALLALLATVLGVRLRSD